MQGMLKFMRFALAAVIVLAAIETAAAQDTEVVSEINGKKITRSELHEQESSALLQARYDFFKAEQKALYDLIAKRLLDAEAARQKLTVDELLKREVDSKVKDLTEDQLRTVYDVIAPKESFEIMRVKIQESVRTQRVQKARGLYLDGLREKANVLVLLAPPRTDVEVGDAARLGPANAPVQLVEFADYECPYCIKVHPEVQKLKAEFGDRLSVVFKDYPLPMHSHAQKAAEAARCAGAQDKFWQYHDRLFAGMQMDVPQLKQLAADLGLDAAKFNTCLESGQQAAAVQKDAAEAQKIGLSATPSFFLNGHFFTGAMQYEDMRQMVLRELSTEKKEGKAAAAKQGQ
jgi:predicted DsbA family dithiol-disulfide isomerase